MARNGGKKFKGGSVWALCVACLALLQCATGNLGMELPTTKLDGVAWFVQISDLHLSRYDHLPDRQKLYGDKLGDLRTFARTVLLGLQPGALLMTGDLIDAKTRLGRGKQWEVEWQDYRRALDIITQESGLPESSILDIRGNHDAFDMGQRGGNRDFFPAYAAAGRRQGMARVYNYPLPSGPYGPQYESQASCPTAMLVGIDATPSIGLRGPTNFAGWLTAEQTGQLEAELASQRTKECNPPVIVYGHYPLPTIQEPETKPWVAPAMGRQRPQQDDLLRVLTRHNVSAYLSGHLHAAFGQRVHRLHRTPTNRQLAELESAAWKDDRRFRLLSVDGGVLSFVDLFMHTPSKPRSSAGPPGMHQHEDAGKNISITGVAPEVVVRKHLVHITSPPDARYAPLQAPAGQNRPVYGEVRALVVPVIPDRSGTKFPVLPQIMTGRMAVQVLLTWRCAKSDKTGQNTMAQVQVGQNLWRAPWAALDQPCSQEDGLVYIRVHALERVTGKSPPPLASSEERPVSLIRSEGGKMLFTTPRKPRELHLKLLEHIVLHLDWQLAAQKVFHLLWALHLGLLLIVPKLLSEWGLPEQLHSVMKLQPPVLRKLTGLLAAPVLDLCSMASVPSIWLPQVLYSLYLVVGPWMAAEYLSGEPPGMLFMGTVYFRWGREWRARADADTLRLGMVHLGTFLLPATLWIASVVHRWSQPDSGALRWPFSAWQIAAAAPILALHGLIAYRMTYVSFGWPAVLFSPGLAWCTPLISLLLYAHYRRREPLPASKKTQ